MMESNSALKRLAQLRDSQNAVLMVADQTPRGTDSDYWTEFLHQDTCWFTGLERIAKMLDYAVVFEVYNLTLLDHVENSATKEVLESYAPSVKNEITTISNNEWNAVNDGLRQVVEDLSAFDNVNYQAAGKTGTAQQVHNRPNHALFVGYAPYNNPEISIATRIAYGYSSGNAALVSSQVMSYYFGEASLDDIKQGNVGNVTTNNSVTD